MPKRIALVAGEKSGDQLGAALIRELAALHHDVRFVGIGGQEMRAAGMECWWDCEELALFGLFEVVRHVPRLWRLRRDLIRRIQAARPDVFIGIDAPDFNLGLERRLRTKGIRTIHYVSPTVWAWRARRVNKIRRAADRVLCLFPFEPAFYQGHGVDAVYVGHPMADAIAVGAGKFPARQRLGIEPDRRVVAILPGSRRGEVSRLAGPMIEAAQELQQQHPDLQFVTALANPVVGEQFRDILRQSANPGLLRCIDGQARSVLAAADVVLCTSGTITLEAMLINRPMVAAYRLSTPTRIVAETLNLLKTPWVSLPNVLAGEELVPELIQDAATPERMAAEVDALLGDEERREIIQNRFATLHESLRCNAARRAASAVSDLM